MKVVFLFPGADFTSGFVQSWSAVLNQLVINTDLEIATVFEYSSDIYWCRNSCLAFADLKITDDIKPFGGVLYDKVFWIDSDMTFTYDDVKKLIYHDVDIVSGVCPIELRIEDKNTVTTRAAFGRYVEDTENGGLRLQYANTSRVGELPTAENGLHEIDFAGGAFLAVKQGVYEAIGFPWYKTVEMDGVFFSEDTGFCARARRAGFKVWVDPTVRIGHEKRIRLPA